jgi:hypothetical protein
VNFDMSDVSTLPAGRYALCLSIEDPAAPAHAAVRFANNNYWQGGLHPVGRIVGLDRLRAADYVEPVFPDLFTMPVDNTLGYYA